MPKHGSPIATKIRNLARKRKAVILAHNYQRGEIQDVADYLGDSLELSRKAAQTDAEIIVFCGVHFMAETASILNPNKIVLTPDENAGCRMAEMISIDRLKSLKSKHPHATVLSYVNTTATVKAESDICCTSANAVNVVKSIKAQEIIFVPDKYLAAYVQTKVNKKIIPWNGYCPTHVKILPEDVLKQKKLHPRAIVLVHPECIPPVIALADEVLSTSGMCEFALRSNSPEIIVGTETGLLYRLQKENPDKKFYAASDRAVCPNMKIITLPKLLWALQETNVQVKVPENIQIKAKKALDRMLEVR